MTWEYSEDNLIEQTAINLFYERLGWNTAIAYNKETFGEDSTLGRLNKREVILKRNFLSNLKELNPGLPDIAYTQALEKLTEDTITKSFAELNYEKYLLLRDGIPIDYTDEKGKQVKNKYLKVFDFENPEKNDFLAVRQLWIEGKSKRERRPDIIGFVNGIPLLFIELKAAHRKLENAYNNNFMDYLDVIQKLFHFNAFVLLSNGIESRIGSITGKYQHFHEWKRITEEEEGIVSLDKIIVGVCEKSRFMDLFENFILFDRSFGKVIKLIARNHQYIGVNKAIANLKEKEKLYKGGQIDLEEKQKLGVFWHTQGSGKSYSMVFMCQKIHRKFTGSYTFLIVTDRNELDTQIYGTFSGVGAVPPIKSGNKNSIKASSGEHLKKLLKEDHRYLFTLIHKFNFSEEITEREDLIVISDEAHRTQGGTLAMNMRNVLPKASFIGFTGTPLFKDDELTKRIFGDYVSKYDFKRSVDDGATLPLYYENRGEYLGIKNPEITAQIREIIDQADDLDSDQRSRVEQLFAREYPILTAKKRLKSIAKDIVQHFCNRGYKGKGMLVSLDKITAVKMYDHIIKYWNKNIDSLENEISRGKYGDQELLEKQRELIWIKETEICVVVSSEQNEIKKFKDNGLDIEPHREKMNSQDLETRFKDENDPFRFVIVCAMWITGFDVPSLSTMYIDKPLMSHTLMQTIARANRVHEGKNNGLIVDYIETYKSLLDALAIYGTGRKSVDGGEEIEPPVKPKEELISQLENALDSTEKFLSEEVNFELRTLIYASGLEKIAAMEKAINAVYTNDETKYKFQLLARDVFKKYKALMPDKLLTEYAPRKNAIDVIYTAIEDNIESADVSEIMNKIQYVVDESIENMIKEPHNEDGKLIDLSGLNFELLEKYFLKTPNKNAAVQSLKTKIEKQLKRMVEQNPLRVDFYEKYQEIIDEYNRGKDSVIIEETFKQLIEFVNSLSEEEARVKREDLTEEQAAIFDILRKPTLTEKEKKKIKEIAKELLDDLKKEKLRVEQWSEKSVTAAAVFNAVDRTLFNQLPYPTYQNDEIEVRVRMIFDHLQQQYYGGGLSVYGPY
ncbi:MAG: type I restriction endonuclease subunit R [Ignavibacteriota bacterium]|nr:type I restriction endonuclease subunit R [Ignavibacteriota bacterium]MCO6448899.1 type I restriction endonuclease subunit R [Ignavibacterium album]MCZ2267851.1 type I restriction endonuclease subunit R [Ignavibacteriales bacterium]QKK00948.1 MAG: type I restriction endonuclease subunit R [Ignavibacteriota bacterium]HOJ07765.1 type I restriction endonuclease subunit R [Ignavibacteriaceae bacterium]